MAYENPAVEGAEFSISGPNAASLIANTHNNSFHPETQLHLPLLAEMSHNFFSFKSLKIRIQLFKMHVLPNDMIAWLPNLQEVTCITSR